MSELKFFRCKKCGEVLYAAVEGPCTPQCCGEPTAELVANTTDAAKEKHVPAITPTDDGKRIDVVVGSVEHPMLEEHSIQFIAIAREDGTVEFKHLKPGEEPRASFCLHGGSSADVYEFCNLHGLWKASYQA